MAIQKDTLKNFPEISWHNLTPEEVFEKLHATSEGLTFKELNKIAYSQTNNQMAQIIQTERSKLFLV